MKNLTVTDWYRQFVRTQVQPGDLCIDATAGNGNDTALLCQLTGPTGRFWPLTSRRRLFPPPGAGWMRWDFPTTAV